MNAAEILNAAAEAEPELIEKTAKALYVLEHTAPGCAAELVEEIDLITNSTGEKVAAVASAKQYALGAGGLLAAGLAAAVATDLYDAAKRGLTKGSNFRRMVEANPDLKHADKGALHTAFSTVHRYAPEMTADPMVAGQLTRTLVESPENSAGTVRELLQARKALADSKGAQFRTPSQVIPMSVGDSHPSRK